MATGAEMMALVRDFEKIRMARNTVHGEVSATYSVFSDNGETYLQIDTYGSKSRKLTGKKSQSIQLGPEALAQLKSILTAI